MLEGTCANRHPGTLRKEWTSLYLHQSMKQGVDLTKYLLLHSLIPSNITFQYWWGLQGRCTPAQPTAEIGSLSQPGLWESSLNFSGRVLKPDFWFILTNWGDFFLFLYRSRPENCALPTLLLVYCGWLLVYYDYLRQCCLFCPSENQRKLETKHD